MEVKEAFVQWCKTTTDPYSRRPEMWEAWSAAWKMSKDNIEKLIYIYRFELPDDLHERLFK